MYLNLVFKYHYLADECMNDFIHPIPYAVNTVQRLFRLWCSKYSGKLLIANPSQYCRSAEQPPNLSKQYIFQMLCRDTMHQTFGICSAFIFLADIVNILDRFGSEHRSITVAAINQTCKWFYRIARPLRHTAFIFLLDPRQYAFCHWLGYNAL